ncbi:MAG: glycosyltransferase [bacterium]
MRNLSFIIVSWNAKEFLLECLDSLAYETGPRRAEIIVVDNGSDDGSPEAVAQEFPQTRLVRNRANLGFAKANNIGIERSAGDFLFLVNSDVKVLPGCIDRMVDFSARAPVRFYLEMLRANLHFWKKHHSPAAQIGFRCISLLYHALRVLQGLVLYPFMPAEKPALKLRIRRSIACVSRLLRFPAQEIQWRTE